MSTIVVLPFRLLRNDGFSGSILAAGSASFFFKKFSRIEALLENNADHAYKRFRNGDATDTTLLKGTCQANGIKEQKDASRRNAFFQA